MFAVFQWTPPKKRNFFARRRIRKKGIYPVVRQISAEGIPYYAIELEQTGPINYAYLQNAAGREASRLLLPEDFPLPQGCGIQKYDSSLYKRRQFFAALEKVLKASEVPPHRLSIGLLDPEGRCPKEAMALLQFTDTVRVMTYREQVYEDFSEEALGLFGTGFIYSDKSDILKHCQVIAAPFGLKNANIIIHNQVIFSGVPSSCAYAITGECYTLPGKFEQQLPKGIDRLDFASALFDASRNGVLKTLTPDYFTCLNTRIPLKKVARQISILDNCHSKNYNVSIIQADIDC